MRAVEDLQAVKSAGDKRADEIEGEHQHAVRQAGVQQARGVRQPEVRGDAGVREDVHVFAPAEFAPEQLDAREGRAVGEVARVVVAGEGVEAADAEIAARDDHGGARRAPRRRRNAGGQSSQAGQPARRQGFVHGPGQRERHEVAAVATEHGRELERAPARQQRGGGGRGVAEGREAVARRDAHGKLIGRGVHAGGTLRRRADGQRR